MKEYCNPINIPYKFQHYGKSAHREAADPTLVLFQGRYYLFASMSAGFYYSDDLMDWKWQENRNLDIYRYAPDVRQIGDWLYFCASDRGTPSTIWRTKDPLSGQFEKVSEPFDFWDPDLFVDDDGRVYLYWGCGNTQPIYGIELDPATMLPIGEKKALIDQDMTHHGWERGNFPGKEKRESGFPMNVIMYFLNRSGRPYMEGAFMTKYNGKYYLQYAAPGTEHAVYGDGYYVGDSPLGPFTFGKNTPFSFKPGGFITGAGHGSTIWDKAGNLWHTSTMRISVNQAMERRLGLFPAGFDEDGLLYCNQNFADYPVVIPEGKFDARTLQSPYMLLSYRKPVTASSSLPGHEPELAVNERIRSWWCAQGSSGEWLQVDLGKAYTPHSVQLNFAEESIPLLKKPKAERSKDISTGHRYTDSGTDLRTRYTVECSLDGENWKMLFEESTTEEDHSHPYHIFPAGTKVRYLKVTAVELPYGSRFALSGVRVFGLDNGQKPEPVTSCKAEMQDSLTCKLRWESSESAMGYNIRYGIAPEKLYSSHLVYEKAEVLLTGLNADQDYWFCIDSFNENGVTGGVLQKL